MLPIFTITFNPCIDRYIVIPSLVAEMKLRCAMPEVASGGDRGNVARALTKLKMKAIAVFPAGGYVGNLLASLLKKEQVRYVMAETDSETRENIFLLDECTASQLKHPGLNLKVTWTPAIVWLRAL